jgi:hypothetical protein
MKIARVFPRRTKASPDDDMAFFDEPGLFPVECDEVHVSCAFTYDIPRAERLARAWEGIATVRIGGPAYNERGGEFIPGRYLKYGYIITSRGCPNSCWFCSVPKREGTEIRELQIRDGWNVLDDNILACSEAHVRGVFAMLKRQPVRAQFTGGLEAARLADWHVDLLADLKPKQMFFAYDAPDDYEPLVIAARKMRDAGFTPASKALRAYCLIGYPNDTISSAEKRLRQCVTLGMCPMAMLWRDERGNTDHEWRKFQRIWARPAMMKAPRVSMPPKKSC